MLTHKTKFVINEVRKASKGDDNDLATEEDTQKSKGQPVAMVISGGYAVEGGENVKSMKRKWKEIMKVASTSVVEVNSIRPPQVFGNSDILDEKNEQIHSLLNYGRDGQLRGKKNILDQGSSADIMFDLLKTMVISEEYLTYIGEQASP